MVRQLDTSKIPSKCNYTTVHRFHVKCLTVERVPLMDLLKSFIGFPFLPVGRLRGAFVRLNRIRSLRSRGLRLRGWYRLIQTARLRASRTETGC